MNWDGQDRMQQAIEPEMHRKVLLRAAELVAMGWTTGAGARSAGDARVRGTSPIAISWCLTGAVFRALFEIVGLDCYEGRETSNDVWCREPAEPEAVLRKVAPCVAARW